MSKRSYELSEALSRLINQQPFFACLLLDLLEIQETNMLPTAGTDGKRLLINPEFFNKLSVDERVFVLAHEVMHVILQHPERGLSYHHRGVGPDLKEWSNRKWNQAADYIINDTLVRDGVGRMPVGGLYHPDFKADDLADEVYQQLPDDDSPPEGEGQDQQGGQGDGWDTHMHGDPAEQPTKADIQRAVAGAAEAAKSQGKMPAGMKRLLDEICDPQIPWAEQIKLMLHRIAGKDAATWARPNRRRLAVAPHVYWPGSESHQCGTLCLYEDTSGSVSPQELTAFRGEMVGILTELNPQELYVGSCDSEAHDPEEVTDVQDLIDYESKGGGGTDMGAIFPKLAEHDLRPETLVILTDGYTPWGEEPDYPVIWVITEKSITAPFGETVHLHIAQ